MIFSLKKNQSLLDEDSTQWIFDTFEWALLNFGSDVFHNESALVTPTPKFFPASDSARQSTEEHLLAMVCQHAGLSHWAFTLKGAEEYEGSTSPPAISLRGALRGSGGEDIAGQRPELPIVYDDGLVSNPQALIANFAHMIAQYLGTTASSPPPGGEENWSHVTELLAVFMGFGLMFANSANNFRTVSCGSCQTPTMQRMAYLSQYDVTYTLALFAVLKELPERDVLPHLKKSLRTFYKKAVRELKTKDTEIQRLKSINAPVTTVVPTLPDQPQN